MASWARLGETVLFAAGLSLLACSFLGAARDRWSQERDEAVLLAVERGSVGREAVESDGLLGRLEIPRVGVSASIREGHDEGTLSVAVGHVAGTARPGETGNVALAGHRDSHFRGLRLIRPGDRVVVHVPGRSREYRVESTEVVEPRHTRVLAASADDRLTLITCYPFGFVGKAPRRFVVRAVAHEP